MVGIHPPPGSVTGPLTGLTQAEARRRLDVHGPNRWPSPPPRRLHARVLAQLSDPMILVLLAAGALTAAMQDVADTVIIGAVVAFNTLIGVAQEVRADRAMAALRALTAPSIRLFRDGVLTECTSDDVVPGDCVALSHGDVVPADGVLLTAGPVELDQSLITGESVPVSVEKGAQLIGGTLVTRGSGQMTVTRTGPDSGIGRIAGLMIAVPTHRTPLQRRLVELSRVLVVAVVVLTAIVVMIGLLQNRPLTEMILVGVSLAVAAVPESLPAVVAMSLAFGAYRMAQRNAVVRRLPAVETLGAVTVIATDKTGTITEGRMAAERLWTSRTEYDVQVDGYAPTGAITPVGPVPGQAGEDIDVARLLRDVLLCNDAQLVRDDHGWSVVGDPLEGALRTLAGKGGDIAEATVADWVRVSEVPFDHVTRQMTTVHRHRDGTHLTVRKGAPEAVLGSLPPSPMLGRAAAAAEELARGGYRVIAVADRESTSQPADTPGSELELVGLIGIDDPPRAHARTVVEACRRAGIRLVLVTGDHRETARTIAQRVGIAPPGDDDPEGHTVFSRVRPEDKVALVETLQREGGVVAMLGDGVNDAPALRRADIGVAAGLGGTEVARQAADLVLMDDDLSTVVAAVEEGRRIYANIRAFLLYAVSGGLAEVGVMLFGPALGIEQPLLPAQILWINLVTHGLTGVAFGAEPADPVDMARPPRSPSESIFTPRFRTDLALAATSLTTVALGVGLLMDDAEDQRTTIFLALGLGQLMVAWAIRARTRRRLRRAPALGVAVATAAALLVAGTQVGLLRDLLGTTPVSWRAVALAAFAGMLPALLVGLRIRHERRDVLRSTSAADGVDDERVPSPE